MPYVLARAALACGISLLTAVLSQGVFYVLLQTRWDPLSVPFRWFWCTFLLSAAGAFLGLAIGFLVETPIDGSGVMPFLFLLQFQTSGYAPPQNQMHDYTKPMRFPNLLHWANKIYLTLNFHGTSNARADQVLLGLDIRTGQVGGSFQGLAACFVACFFIAAAAAHRRQCQQ